MLQNIRDRAHGIMAWVILISIAVPFALWGIQNYLNVGKEKPVATVGDRELFERDVNRAAEQDMSGLVGLADMDEKALRRRALDRLIRETLVRDEVRRLGLTLGDDDLRNVIQSLPYFQTEGKFDKEKYKLAVSAKGMTSNGFAAQIRDAVAMDQFQHAISRTAFATPAAVDQYLRLKHQRRTVEYLVVPVPKEGEAPSQGAVEDYYRTHAAQFQTPEQVAVQYVELRLEDLAQQLPVTDEELKGLYEEQKAAYTTDERRKLSHILISVDPGADDAAFAAALEKARQAKQRIDRGEDFGAVAKAVSEDKLSAGKGGDLGYIARGQMERNFEDAAFKLKAGEVSDPVKTAFGYHLIKLTELIPAKTKSFDEVKDELRKTYQRNAAEKKFYDLGEKLSQLSFEHSDSLEPAAEAIGGKVLESGLFTRDAGTGIAANAAVRNAAFAQDVLDGHNSEPVELAPDHVVVLRVKEHRAAAPRSLDEVRTEIIARLRREAAETAARAKAEALFERLQQGAALSELAKTENLSVQKPKPFGRDAQDVPPELLGAVFRMARPEAGQTGKLLTALGNGDQVVLSLLAVEDGDPAKIEVKDKETARSLLARSEGQAELHSFVEQLWSDGDVHIQEAREQP